MYKRLITFFALTLVACGGGGNVNPDDADGDGFTVAQGDCDDGNGTIYPGAPEPCDNVDNDCNTTIDDGFDIDNDGYTSCGGDCRDSDPSSNPGASEVVDGADNDCDGIPDNHTDQYDDDGDGFAEDQGDCNDDEVSGGLFGPNALEVAVDADGNPEGQDNDCDGKVDEAIEPCPLERNVGDPLSYAHAIDLCHEVATASWATDMNIDARSRSIQTAYGASYLPKMGQDFIILSSGIAADSDPARSDFLSTSFTNTAGHPQPGPDPGDGCGTADPTNVNDYTELKVVLDVPQNVKGFSFDFNFMSIEFPTYVCSQFDDTFFAYLESEAFTGNVSFDENGNVVSINIGFFDVCDPMHAPTCMGDDELVGTGFEDEHGGTGWLTTTAPLVGGEKATLTFMIFDEGDRILDSAVMIDNFRWVLDDIEGPITVD